MTLPIPGGWNRLPLSSRAGGVLLALQLLLLLAPMPTTGPFFPLRMLAGGLAVFIIPGFFWAQVLGIRSRHPLEEWATSSAVSLALQTLILPLPFIFGWTMAGHARCILAFSLAGWALAAARHLAAPPSPRPWTPGSARRYLTFLPPLVFAAASYGWGEAIFDISGEKLLHFSYLRQYSTGPLSLLQSGVEPGVPPSNLVHFWEFLLAAWAGISRLDPLALAFRARFIVPALGLPAMFLLLRAICGRRGRAEALYWGVALMAAGDLMLLQPSRLDFFKDNDPTRGAMSFFGTVHHADPAMDILLPLGAALALLAMQSRSWARKALLFVVTAATFLWHPREYFQIGVYVAILGIVLVPSLFGRRQRPPPDAPEPPGAPARRLLLTPAWRQWAMVLGIFAAIALLAMAGSRLLPKDAGGFDEFRLKKELVSAAFSGTGHWTKARSLLHFLRLATPVPPHFRFDEHYLLWLVLSAAGGVCLGLLGDSRMRRFAAFYFLLWFLVFCWEAPALLIWAATYSEWAMTPSRIIYLFSYVAIAGGFHSFASFVFQRVGGSRLSLLAWHALLLAAGIGLALLWQQGSLRSRAASTWVTAFVGIGWVASAVLRRRGLSPVRDAPLPAYLLGLGLFLLPVLSSNLQRNFLLARDFRRPAVDWYGAGSPIGFSAELIRFLQALPPYNIFLVDPSGKGLVSLYCRQYLDIHPAGLVSSILKDSADLDIIAQGKHPFFRPAERNRPVPRAADMTPARHAQALLYLADRRIRYILLEPASYPSLIGYFRSRTLDYRVLFDRPDARESVVEFLPGARPAARPD